MRPRSVLTPVIVTLACGQSQPHPASMAPSPARVDSTAVSAVDPAALPDTGVLGQLKSDLQARIAASERVVHLVVQPDTLRLLRSESVFLPQTFTITASDATGAPVTPFSPAYRVLDRHIVQLRAGFLVGLEVGTTALIVGTPRTDPVSGESGMRDLVRVPIIVLPDTVPR